METVTLNEKEYTKVSLLAKKYKYTTDYIGQLCRAKKIDAELVGRTWYVNEESLKNHKKTRYSKTRTNDKNVNETNKIKISRTRVEPVMTNRGTKLLKNKSSNFAKKIDWKPVKYEFDESELIPDTKRSKKLSIDLADSNEIEISKDTPETDFVPEDLPTVNLKGDLKVSSADVEIEDDLTIENKGFVSKLNGLEKKHLNNDLGLTATKKTSDDTSYGRKDYVKGSDHTSLLFNFFKTIILLMIVSLIGLLVALFSLNFSASNNDDFFIKKIQPSTTIFDF